MKQTKMQIGLSKAQSDRLSALAREHNTLSRSGPTTGEPTWTALVRAIGDGTLRIAAPGKKWEGGKRMKKKKPWRAHPLFAPRWWKPNEMFEMKTADVTAASGLTVEQLVAGGLELLNNGTLIIPKPGMSGWFNMKEEE